MKKIIIISVALLALTACKKNKEKSIEDILSSNNITKIRAYKDKISLKQQALINDLKLLDKKIITLDSTKKRTLVATTIIKPTLFNHYLELQGSVNTKNLLILTPEFSGILNRIFVKAGQRVRKGQLLAKIDDSGLEQQLAQLKIQVNLAKTTFERQKRLWSQKIGSEIQYLQAKSNFEAQQKMVLQMQKQLSKTTIKAPFNGTIDEIITEQGNVVSAGMTPILRIVNLNDMYVETDVSENYITTITKGKKVTVHFPVLNKTITTKIQQVGNYINPSNRTFRVKIAIPNKNKSIKPNLTAKLKINNYTNPKAILIPQNIISENAKGEQYIYTLKDKKENTATVVKTVVKTGLTKGDLIEIIDNLPPNSEVITEGSRMVKDGQKVTIIK